MGVRAVKPSLGADAVELVVQIHHEHDPLGHGRRGNTCGCVAKRDHDARSVARPQIYKIRLINTTFA